MSYLIELNNISMRFGGLYAVNEVSLRVSEGETLGIIGPNGAGKTTLFNIIAGALTPTTGQVLFKGENITGSKPHTVARHGIVRTFQLTTLFSELSVLENILLGFHMKSRMNPLKEILFGQSSFKQEIGWTDEIIKLVGLTGLESRMAGELPHGHQRLLGVGIALACGPKMLLLDEPVAGMTKDEKSSMASVIKGLHTKGLTILLVEHDIRTVMDLCQRILVLNFGCKIAEGSPAEVKSNPDVIEAYLGPEIT